eukprot:2370903-Amphidinium_carterae.1
MHINTKPQLERLYPHHNAMVSEGSKGIIHGFKSLGLIVDEATVHSFRKAQIPAESAAGIICRHHESDLVCIILLDVVTHGHLQHSAITQME